MASEEEEGDRVLFSEALSQAGRHRGEEYQMKLTGRLITLVRELRTSIQEFNHKATKQTTWMLRLTWAIAILTLVMAGGLGFQICLAVGMCS